MIEKLKICPFYLKLTILLKQKQVQLEQQAAQTQAGLNLTEVQRNKESSDTCEH